MRISFLLLPVMFLLTGCAANQSTGGSSRATGPERKAPPPTPNARGEYEAAGKSFRVVFTTAPLPIPMNEPFEIRARIEPIGGSPLGEASLRVDAAMPDHRHGMNTQPQVTREADGTWRVRGMLLHMPGYWELYFDLERDGETERAQYNFELE
ncbi:MAG: hypothetical protein AMXMBFR47_04450 [Planctomycetota bacterium]